MSVISTKKTGGDPAGSLVRAEEMIAVGKDQEASPIYESLRTVAGYAPVALFRLGEIRNRAGDAEGAADYHRKAFLADSALASKITAGDHPFHRYIYRDIEQKAVEVCPICTGEGQPYWVFNMATNADFNEGFDPVRTWMRCARCHHLYASAYPVDLGEVLSGSDNEQYGEPKTSILPYVGSIVSELRKRAPGDRLLEVGVGAGELMAVAAELGFDVTGLEIRPAHAERVSKSLGLPVLCSDFNEFEAKQRFHVICMGDVLEHIPDPVQAVFNAARLLEEGGLFWISTPNFESAFSRIMKDRDPMKRVCEHLNYFSLRSLERLLKHCRFRVVDYRVSAHYNGSMEITAVREAG